MGSQKTRTVTPHAEGSKAMELLTTVQESLCTCLEAKSVAVIEHRKPLSHRVLEDMVAFKGTSKTYLPCSYTHLEAVTAGHCQRQADGLEQPMAGPGLLQQCSLLFWVTMHGRGTAAHRLLVF